MQGDAPAPATPIAPHSGGVVDYDDIWSRALRRAGDKVGCAFDRPLIHRNKNACELQCDEERDRRVWAYDLPATANQSGAPKRYVAATIDELERALRRVPAENRHCYEVVGPRRPCWSFFALEFSRDAGRNAGLDGDELVGRVVELAAAELVAAAAREDPPARLGIGAVILESELPAKFSCHIVLKVLRLHEMLRHAPLSGPAAAACLAARVSEALGAAGIVEGEGGDPTSLLDFSVYHEGLLVESCVKLGEDLNGTLVLDDGRFFVGASGPSRVEKGIRAGLAAPDPPMRQMPRT